MLFDMQADQIVDLVWVLIGHQAASDLDMSLCRSDRLRTISLESAPNAVDVERRTHPETLECGVIGFAGRINDTAPTEKGFLIERHVLDISDLLFGDRADLIVETFDGHL